MILYVDSPLQIWYSLPDVFCANYLNCSLPTSSCASFDTSGHCKEICHFGGNPLPIVDGILIRCYIPSVYGQIKQFLC